MAAAAPRHVQQLAVTAILLVTAAVVSGAPAAATTDTAAPAPAPRIRRAFSALDDGTTGGVGECWGALMQLGSCTDEILIFFFNGESYIGPQCCRAIRGATLHCWPSILASFGFTAEQADVLRDFCDGEAAAAGQQHGGGGAPDQSAPPAAAGGSGNNAPPPSGPGKQ